MDTHTHVGSREAPQEDSSAFYARESPLRQREAVQTPGCRVHPPDSVPVMVEFWPLASRAIPKMTFAATVPTAGDSNRYASLMYATLTGPSLL